MGSFATTDHMRSELRREWTYGSGMPEGLTVRAALTLAYGDNWDENLPDNAAHPRTRYEDGYGYDTLILGRTEHNAISGYDEPDYVANARVLMTDWCDARLVDGGFSLIVAVDLDAEAPKDLIEVLDKLSKDRVLDDQIASAVEMEKILEHWEDHGLADARAALAQRLGVDLADLPARANEWLRNAALFGDYYPDLSAAGADCNFHLDLVVERVAGRLAVAA